jgi:hypothetical protein
LLAAIIETETKGRPLRYLRISKALHGTLPWHASKKVKAMPQEFEPFGTAGFVFLTIVIGGLCLALFGWMWLAEKLR